MRAMLVASLLLLALAAATAACDGSDGAPTPTPSLTAPATKTPARTPAASSAVPKRTSTADADAATETPTVPATAAAAMATVHVSPTAAISTPAPFPPITFSPGESLSLSDLALRPLGPPQPRIDIVPERVLIPDIGVDAPVSFKGVGANGIMPAPDGAYDIAFYDFSSWLGLGGFAGSGGNVIAAGKIDEVGVGPAVLWRLRELSPGARILVRMTNGATLVYVVEFNKVASASMDWMSIVQSTYEESLTLITGAGAVLPGGGGYVDRRIVWGRRVE